MAVTRERRFSGAVDSTPYNPGDQMQPGENKKGGPRFESWLSQELFF